MVFISNLPPTMHKYYLIILFINSLTLNTKPIRSAIMQKKQRSRSECDWIRSAIFPTLLICPLNLSFHIHSLDYIDTVALLSHTLSFLELYHRLLAPNYLLRAPLFTILIKRRELIMKRLLIALLVIAGIASILAYVGKQRYGSDTHAKEFFTKLLVKADVTINGSRPWDIKVHNPDLYQRVLQEGSLGLGES